MIMKKITFESKESVGHFEVPNDATLKVPAGMVVNEEEPVDPLYPAGIAVEGSEPIPDDKSHWEPIMRPETDDNEPMLPNL
jgi:hypothetical protein